MANLAFTAEQNYTVDPKNGQVYPNPVIQVEEIDRNLVNRGFGESTVFSLRRLASGYDILRRRRNKWVVFQVLGQVEEAAARLALETAAVWKNR